MAGGRRWPGTSDSTAVGRTTLLALPLLILSVASLLGTALAPALIAGHHPLVVVALSPRAAFVVVAADQASPAVLVPLVLARLLVADPFHYVLGRLHGGRVAAWLGDRIPGARPAHDLMTRLLHRAGAPAIAISPTGKFLTMAGALGLPPRHVAVADVAGTVIYTATLVTVGRAAGGTLLLVIAVVATGGLAAAGATRLGRRLRDASAPDPAWTCAAA